MNLQINIHDIDSCVFSEVRHEDNKYDYISCYSNIFPSIHFNVGDKIDLPSFKDYLSQGELYYPDESCSYLSMELILRTIEDVTITEIKHVYTNTHGYVLCLQCDTYNP